MQPASGFELMKCVLEREGERLKLDLANIHGRYEHAGNKGESAEQIFREFLSRYLPAHNRVGHGEVFNIDGLRSRQTDLVITNEYHIRLKSDWSEPQMFILESVKCAGEVKSIIKDRNALRAFFEKARVFKSMLIEPDQGTQVRSHEEDFPRFVWRKPYFGFAFESEMNIDRIVAELRSWETELRPIDRPVLDGLFVLDRGGTIHMGKGSGQLRSLSRDGKPQSGYVVVRDAGEQVLAQLLLWIYTAMPRIEYYTHPAFPYLRPNPHSGRLSMTDDGTLRRPLRGIGPRIDQ